MFGLFKKKSELEKLQAQYKQLMKDYHRLSTTDRTASDKAFAQADEVAKKMDALK
jgi:archaellum component FlaC